MRGLAACLAGLGISLIGCGLLGILHTDNPPKTFGIAACGLLIAWGVQLFQFGLKSEEKR